MNYKDTYGFDGESIDSWIQDAMKSELPAGLTTLTDAAMSMMYDQTKRIMGTMIEYKELMMMYTCAMKEIRTKFEVLNTEFNVRYQRNPISSISTRLKRTSSITDKLSRTSSPFSISAIEENIHDVAGVRVICSYIDDIYRIADSFLAQDDITLVTRKDYIATPKPNGYRSLHLIIKVPVFFAEQKKNMTVEVQIRTIAMDFWASLEHQLKYKQDIPNQQDIIADLKGCAEIINATDQKTLAIRQQIEQMTDTPDEDCVLFDKFSRLDINLG